MAEDKAKNKNVLRAFKPKQFITYGEHLLNLLTISSFKYFYSGQHEKYYLGYYTNAGTWTTIDSSFDEDTIREKFEGIKKELMK